MPALDLGIECATDEPSIALLDGERALVERAWTVTTTLTRELLAAIDGALRDAGVARTDLASIAVDVGPGAYTGLRTAVATAQGIALALGIPLAGVGRLEAAAFPHLAAGAPVVAIHDVGRGNVAWAAYRARAPGAPPEELRAPGIDAGEDCVRAAPAGALWCGELPDALREARAAAGRGADPEAAGGENIPRAASLVRLGRLHAAYGDPALVDAVYLRPPPITRPRQPA